MTVDNGSGCISTSTAQSVTVNNFIYNGTIYSENMGSPVSTTFVNSYTGWQNGSPISYSSTGANQSDLRTTSPSFGYAGASGGGNVLMSITGTNDRNLIVAGINTLGITNAVLSFGLLRDNTANGITVEVSPDGISYSPLSITQPASANTWTLVTASGSVPSTSNLRIRFSKNNTTSFRIDDIKIAVSANTVIITPVGSTTICGSGSINLVSNIPAGNLWSPGAETSQSITVSVGGSYTVTATGTNGCTATSAPVSVQVVPQPGVSIISTTNVTCNGGSDGTATAGGNNGTSGQDHQGATGQGHGQAPV